MKRPKFCISCGEERAIGLDGLCFDCAKEQDRELNKYNREKEKKGS